MRSKYSSRSNRFRILPNGERFERSVAIERLESGIRYNALKRAFDIDIEHCPNCGGSLKVIAAPSTRSGQTFYDTCQVPFLFFHVAWRIFCRAMLARW